MVDDVALAAEFSTRGGVSTRSRLRRRGLTDRQIDRLIGCGRLLKAGRGVLVDTCSPDTWLRDVAIACAATGGIASFHTALHVWRFPGVPPTTGKHVTVAHGRRVDAPPGVVMHRCRDVDERDVVQHAGGFEVWSPLRALVDAAAIVDAGAVERMVDHAIGQRMCTIHTLVEVCGRAWHPARPGSCALARVLHSRPAWLKPVRSSYESKLERALLAGGFPTLVREHSLVLLDGHVVHPDLGIPDERFFIEIDHPTWHGGLDNAYDRARDLEASAPATASSGCRRDRSTNASTTRSPCWSSSATAGSAPSATPYPRPRRHRHRGRRGGWSTAAVDDPPQRVSEPRQRTGRTQRVITTRGRGGTPKVGSRPSRPGGRSPDELCRPRRSDWTYHCCSPDRSSGGWSRTW